MPVRSAIVIALGITLLLGTAGTVLADDGVMTKEKLISMTPDQAQEMLKKGNQNFTSGKSTKRDWPAEVKKAAKGQYPFAAVVSCLDSRIPVEVVFDQGIGDLFVARVAGNFVNDDILGSLEFAATRTSEDKWIGVRLIVVMGHTGCGAIKGAVAEAELGLLTGTLANINPALNAVKHATGKNSDDQFVKKVTIKNVQLTMQKLRDRSLVLRRLIDKGDIKLVGVMYDISTGQVTPIKPGT